MGKSETIQEVIENMGRISHRIEPAAFNAFGVSRAQAGMLHMLHHHSGASVKQLAEFMGITKSAITQLLDPLVSSGLVKRESDPKDRRVVSLSLTAKGKGVLTKLKRHKTEALRAALSSLNEKELHELVKIYKKMNTNIS